MPSNCCLIGFRCGVLGNFSSCEGYIPTSAEGKTGCSHANASNQCTSEKMIAEKVIALAEVYKSYLKIDIKGKVLNMVS